MPHVVLLRGVNVGGNKTFRPKALAAELAHLGAVNIGAAGTFVIRQSVTQAAIQKEFAERLPFETRIIICRGSEILGLFDHDWFKGYPASRELVRFVTVFERTPRPAPSLPIVFPADGDWLVRVVGLHKRFVFGVYRRHPKTIQHLGALDKRLGSTGTTRNWNTITAIAKALGK